MKLVCRIQQALVTAHRSEDNGDFVFVLCRRGFEAALQKRFHVGELVTVEVDIKTVDLCPTKTP